MNTILLSFVFFLTLHGLLSKNILLSLLEKTILIRRGLKNVPLGDHGQAFPVSPNGTRLCSEEPGMCHLIAPCNYHAVRDPLNINSMHI